MSDRRELPRIEWGAILVGLAATLALALLATAFGIVGIGLPVAVGAGGYLAARRAPAGRLFHAAVVGASWVLIFGFAEAGPEAPGVVADTAATLAVDTLYMCAALLGGWLAGRR